MTQRLKRWESPRRQGRNDKGKGGSARQRQLKKQQQMLRKKLKEGQQGDNHNNQGGREVNSLPFFVAKGIRGELGVGTTTKNFLSRAIRFKLLVVVGNGYDYTIIC